MARNSPNERRLSPGGCGQGPRCVWGRTGQSTSRDVALGAKPDTSTAAAHSIPILITVPGHGCSWRRLWTKVTVASKNPPGAGILERRGLGRATVLLQQSLAPAACSSSKADPTELRGPGAPRTVSTRPNNPDIPDGLGREEQRGKLSKSRAADVLFV